MTHDTKQILGVTTIVVQDVAGNVAEDMAEVVSLSESVTVQYGSFDDCLQTRGLTPLEPEVNEYKDYAPGVG